MDKFRIWDVVAEVQPDSTLEGHEGSAVCLTFDPNGRFLASGSRDYSVRLWDVEAALAQASSREESELGSATIRK